MWGCSSAGRALPSQGRGREFKSLHLHHHDDQRSDNIRPLFLFSPFRAFFPPCPLGERYPHGSSTNSIWPPSALYQKKQRFLPADVRAQKKRRSECPGAPELRIFVRPSLADACPARAQHGRGHPIPSRPPPMTEVHAASLPSPPCPFRRASFNRHVPADGLFPHISPTCPRQRRACRTAPRLPIPPVRNIPVP